MAVAPAVAEDRVLWTTNGGTEKSGSERSNENKK